MCQSITFLSSAPSNSRQSNVTTHCMQISSPTSRITLSFRRRIETSPSRSSTSGTACSSGNQLLRNCVDPNNAERTINWSSPKSLSPRCSSYSTILILRDIKVFSKLCSWLALVIISPDLVHELSNMSKAARSAPSTKVTPPPQRLHSLTTYQNDPSSEPQANGLVERLNRTILNVLRTSINAQDNEWDLWIPITQAAINSTFHSSLGDIPNYVVYGDDQRLPYELLQQRPTPVYGDDYAKIVIAQKQEAYRIAREHLRVERDRIIAQQHKLARRKEIADGVLVFHRVSDKSSPMPKLAPDFEGPLRVLKVRHNKALCQNLITNSQAWYHFDTLKLASTHYEDEFDRQRSLTSITPTGIAPDSTPATSFPLSSPGRASLGLPQTTSAQK
ncbi:uncharacterized protein LOC119574411 [Penaeus monodon]|uniref:uncharacterized protein LOC119574411 n=1 Tax=Penaeus monodon TaxID=6687 RepID=UPI0018A6D888|nr:uncharacterized protein LOC119574411 [Penaeus monodon]